MPTAVDYKCWDVVLHSCLRNGSSFWFHEGCQTLVIKKAAYQRRGYAPWGGGQGARPRDNDDENKAALPAESLTA